MIQVNVHQAKSQLSKLIAQAEAGEEVVIARDGVPVVRMAPVMTKLEGKKKRNLFGAMKGEFTLPTDEEWRRMDEEIARQMLEGPIFPDDTVLKGEAAE